MKTIFRKTIGIILHSALVGTMLNIILSQDANNVTKLLNFTIFVIVVILWVSITKLGRKLVETFENL